MAARTSVNITEVEVSGRRVKLVPVPGRPHRINVWPANVNSEFSRRRGYQQHNFVRYPYLEFEDQTPDAICAELRTKFACGDLRLIKRSV